jgi:Peptidase M15
LNLTTNFTLNEATFSQAAERAGINNTPSPVVLANIKNAANSLQEIRDFLGAPIRVSSWYRNSATNKIVGGAKNSAHLLGWAIDFDCESLGTPLQVALKIAKSDIRFDQLIHEFGRWVHISFEPKTRGELLTVDNFGTRIGLVPTRR